MTPEKIENVKISKKKATLIKGEDMYRALDTYPFPFTLHSNTIQALLQVQL